VRNAPVFAHRFRPDGDRLAGDRAGVVNLELRLRMDAERMERMSMRPRHGRAPGVRNSALWGTGSRGGEHRSSALWGRSAKGALTTAIALVALALPLAATAGSPTPKQTIGGLLASLKPSYVDPALLEKAKKSPDEKVRVIIRASSGGIATAQNAVSQVGSSGSGGDVGKVMRRLGLIEGIAVELPAARIEKLARLPLLEITEDVPLKASEVHSVQKWPYSASLGSFWGMLGDGYGDRACANYRVCVPAIAIVDSGIDAGRPDFGGRVVASQTFASLTPNSPGDGRGHGTFVAGIAAGSTPGLAGGAPTAKLVSLDVMNDYGMALTSDVIAAIDWIIANKSTYNIRVANFSLNAADASSIRWNPLNRAVEKLWLNGVVVVTAAGNYAVGGAESGVVTAPANDPFVITAGAVDVKNTTDTYDDVAAPFSAYGYTLEGFGKPDVAAPGRYMVGPASITSTLATEKAGRIVHSSGYLQLSGTSFAAPVVSAAAAWLLAVHPTWTPDQVKGALMLTARGLPLAAPRSVGAGEVNVVKAALLSTTPPNPNLGLNAYVASDANGAPVFDAAAWSSAAQANAAWNSAAWNTAAWNTAAWSSAAWSSAAWNTAAWSSAAWNTAAWNNAAWNTAAWNNAAWNNAAWNNAALETAVRENAAEDDISTESYELTDSEVELAKADPVSVEPAQ
jgi:serine protease AprX